MWATTRPGSNVQGLCITIEAVQGRKARTKMCTPLAAFLTARNNKDAYEILKRAANSSSVSGTRLGSAVDFAAAGLPAEFQHHSVLSRQVLAKKRSQLAELVKQAGVVAASWRP